MFRLIKLEDRIVLDGNDFNNSSPTVVVSDPLPGMEIVTPFPLPNQGKTPVFSLIAGRIMNYDISPHIVDYDHDPITYIYIGAESLDGGSKDWLENHVSLKGSHLMIDSSAPLSEVGKTYAINFTADDQKAGHTPISFVFKFKVENNTAPQENKDALLPTAAKPLELPAETPLVYDLSQHITDTEKDQLVYSYTGGIALENGGTKWYEGGEFQGGKLKIFVSPSAKDEYKNYILNFTVSDKSSSGDILHTTSFSLRVQIIPNGPPHENTDNPVPTLYPKQGTAGLTHELKDHFTDTEKDTLKYSLTDIRDDLGNKVSWSSEISIDENGKLTISDLKDAEPGKEYTINFTVSDEINDPVKSFISLQINPNSAPHESKSNLLPTADSPSSVTAGQALNIDMSKYITDDEKDPLTYFLTGIRASDGGSMEWLDKGLELFNGSTLVTSGVPPVGDVNHKYIVDFTVKDDYHTEQATFSMYIQIGKNSPPVLDKPLPGDGVNAIEISKGQSGAYPLADYFRDPDGDQVKFGNLQIIAVDGGSTAWFDNASFDDKGNLKIPAPGTSEVGRHYVVNFFVSDGINIKAEDIKSYSIPIVIPNHPPAFASEKFSLTIPQNIPSEVPLGNMSSVVSDADGDTLKYSIVGGDPDQRFAINPDTGELKIVSTEHLNAGDHFELKILAKENKVPGLSAETTIVIDVKAKINQIPRENSVNPKPLPLIWDAGQSSFEYDLSAHYSDPDNDTIRFEYAETLAITPFKTDTAWKLALSADGKLTATLPDGQSEGDYVVRFNVNDGNGGVITDAIEIRFKEKNSDPAVYDQTFSVSEASYARMPVGIVPASDSDGDKLSYSILPESDPRGIFSIDSNGMIRVIRPELLDSQKMPQIVLKVRVEDVLHASDEATVTVNVEKSPALLFPQKYLAEISEDRTAIISIPGSLTIIGAEGKSDATKGKVILLADNKILYDPGNAFQSLAEGEIRYDVFTYTVSDGIRTAKAPIVVAVKGVNDPPTIGGVGNIADIRDTDTIKPLSGFTISDIDVYNDGRKDIQSVTVWIDHPENGRIILSDGFTDNGNGRFSITGTAETVQQALRNIVFEPVPSDLPFEIKETKFWAEIQNHDRVENLATISSGSTISPSEAYSAEKVWIGTEIMIPYYGISWKDTSSELLGLSIEHGLPVFTLKNLKLDEFDFGLPDETENVYELVNRMLREAKLFTDIDETMYPQKYSQEITDANRNTENWRIDIHPLEVR